MSESSFRRIGIALLIVISTTVGTSVVTAGLTPASTMSDASGASNASNASNASDVGDTRANAVPIDLSNTIRGKLTSNDTDWYAVHLKKGRGVSARLESSGTGDTNFRVRLYGPDGSRVVHDRRSKTDRTTVGGVVERSGTYYVKVESGTSTKKPTNYALTVTSQPLGKHDPNERRSQAAQLESGTTVTGVMTGYDRDYFSIAADAGGVISIDPSTAGSIDTVIVYGPDGERIHTSSGSGVRRIETTKSGRYTVALASDLELTETLDYTLTLTATTPTNKSPNSDTPRRIEPGNVVSGSIGSDGTDDTYTVSLEKGQGFTVFLNHTNRKDPSEEMSFEVHSPDGNRIGEAPFDRPLRAYSTSAAAASAYGGDVAERSGTYQITVSGDPGAAYSIRVDTTELDGNDPNEQVGSASEITGNTTVSGVLSGYDRDVYAIDLQKGNTVAIEYNSSGGFPPAFWVAGPDVTKKSNTPRDYSFGQNTIASGHSGGNLTFMANRTGTYYIKAVPYFERSTAGTFFDTVAYEMRIAQGETVRTLTHTQTNQTSDRMRRLNASMSTMSQPTSTATTTPTTTDTPTTTATPTAPPTTAPTTAQPNTSVDTSTRTKNTNTNGDTSTTTGPGFGVFATLIGLGAGGWLYRLRKQT